MWLTNLALAISLPSALGAIQQVAFQPIAAENPVFESSWNDLNARPDANATGHLIFDTVSSLLQHWPNTRYRNGHNIIPGMMYHFVDTNSAQLIDNRRKAGTNEAAFGIRGMRPASKT
ncbi:hypothetical protein DFH09DRAFT_276670 [Mycena vulgaris]|nr:hypothetical protein DFH09DRAFT_276670 [Mycena vulgaris]